MAHMKTHIYSFRTPKLKRQKKNKLSGERRTTATAVVATVTVATI